MFSCLPCLVWYALPHIGQYLFIFSVGGIHASHVSVAVKSGSDFPKLCVFALFQFRLALALLYADV